jgi:hypothetical protein
MVNPPTIVFWYDSLSLRTVKGNLSTGGFGVNDIPDMLSKWQEVGWGKDEGERRLYEVCPWLLTLWVTIDNRIQRNPSFPENILIVITIRLMQSCWPDYATNMYRVVTSKYGRKVAKKEEFG